LPPEIILTHLTEVVKAVAKRGAPLKVIGTKYRKCPSSAIGLEQCDNPGRGICQAFPEHTAVARLFRGGSFFTINTPSPESRAQPRPTAGNVNKAI
jgi:hypothetical protein